jgi:hypothetical protein
MTRFLVAASVLAALLVTQGFSQSGAVIPQGGAGHADAASCVILKRMGPADQITSHLYSFGIRGKQFQYVEGKLPDGFPFHGRLTDHDVRNLQGRGTEVVVLNQDFTAEDLKQARSDCKLETGKTPMQADQQAKPAQAPGTSATPAPTATAVGATEVSVSSTPSGADIEVDGKFVGSTPSSINVPPGDHKIAVKKSGFVAWSRDISTSSGHVTINAELEEVPRPAATETAAPAAAKSHLVSQVMTSPAASTPAVPVGASSPTAPALSDQPELVLVSVTSDPSGADIFVDSKGVGGAPKQLQLRPGSHSIVLVKQGYKDWSTKVTVGKDPTAVNAKLEK